MYVRVRVQPGAKKESILRKSETEFDIMVREPALRNLANKRVIELVAQECNVEPKKVKILTGHHSRTKLLSADV